jgi:hypothetical protein
MDRFAANTLRTVGIILTAGFVVIVGLALVLLSMCAAAPGFGGGGSHPEKAAPFIAGAIATLIIGIWVIALLARGIHRYSSEEYWPTPPDVRYSGFPAPQAVPTTAPRPAPPSDLHTDQLRDVPSAQLPPPRPIDVTTHLSPASRAAIRQLAIAVAIKIAAEVVVALSGWQWTLRSRLPQDHVFRFSFLAWGLAAIAPNLVLLFALLRRPGPRAFAYALVIPALHVFFGFFGHSATLFVLFSRSAHGMHPVLSLFTLLPWFIDILILYLAWKAIRLTGIHPNPARLIIASVVIFLYTCLLPVLFGFLIYFHR